MLQISPLYQPPEEDLQLFELKRVGFPYTCHVLKMLCTTYVVVYNLCSLHCCLHHVQTTWSLRLYINKYPQFYFITLWPNSWF